MTRTDEYRRAFEHESEANHAMLDMLGGVPESAKADSRFQQAVNIASHMCACRRNYLNWILGSEPQVEPWFEDDADVDTLESRFTQMEADWRAYLTNVDESAIQGFFTFSDNGQKWKMAIEAQLFQLIGHANYHRGQVVLLVDQLGGETVDTDYILWFERNVPGGCGAAE
jgi:uncharacterized damage-inducible protein DinB